MSDEQQAIPREFDHFSIVPFKAICGADRAGQTTSQTPERVKCPICWLCFKEWSASRSACLARVAQPPDDGWVTFGRVKVDIENETETFERIDPNAASLPPPSPQCEDLSAAVLNLLNTFHGSGHGGVDHMVSARLRGCEKCSTLATVLDRALPPAIRAAKQQ